MSRNVILYIAMSLDGYIAKENDDINFLNIVEKEGEDYGHSSFTQSIDTIFWGRKTYDKVLSFGIDFPYPDKKVIVFSKSRTGKDDNVEYFGGNLSNLIAELKSQDGLDIYCDGGAELVAELLKQKLIDKLIISVIPHLLGSGIKLFKEGVPEQNLLFQKSITFPTGLVQLYYNVKK